MLVTDKLRTPTVIAIAAFALMAATKSSTKRSVTVTEGTNVNLTLSPDHKTIILDLQETLWSLPISGGTAKRLTDPFLEPARPDWSAKGDLVAFQSFKGGTFHIWLMKPDGTGIRQLTEGHGDDRDPRFSPDGTRVAFSSDRAFKGNYDIWVADIQSGKVAQWTTAPADEYEPTWSPNGSEIAFVSGTGANATAIQSVNASGEVKNILTAAPGAHLDSPAYSPDGRRIAYTEIAAGKSRMMVDKQPVSDANDVFPFPPTWLSANEMIYTGNGKILVSTIGGGTKTLAFQATFDINRPAYKHRAVDFDSAAPRPIRGIVNPALSPDGNHVVFEALNQLWLMEIGGKPHPLTHDNFYKQSPAWSPDGKRIAFSSDKAGTADIYIYDLASQTERRVTSLPDSAEFAPAWSPDGTKLAFNKQNDTTYIVDLATGEIKEVVKPTYQPGRPSWSANGKSISLAVLRPYNRRFREGTSLIETVDLTTGKSTLTEPAPYKSISTRSVDGPIYSPDGTRMTYVMDGYLWVRPVNADGLPVSEARAINEEMTDSPTWSGDGKRLLYLSNGTLRMVSSDGSTPPSTVPLDLSFHRETSTKKIVVHAGRLWDGLGPNERTNVDVTIVGRRIQKIAPHLDKAHQRAEVIDASDLTVIPGLWESHNHGYGGLSSFGDRAGRIWLAYGFTELQSQGDSAYDAVEIKESFASNARVGPRYFAGGEPIDGERGYYGMDHGVTNSRELQLELSRAQALGYDNVKTYVRLPHELQAEAMRFAHEKLGVWIASHYGLPGVLYGMDGMTHVSATSRWGYSYTRSTGGESYDDIRKLFAAANEFIISTPFAASALYAEDPTILDDPRIATLNTPWEQRTMAASRDQAIHGDGSGIRGGTNLQGEEATLLAVMHNGGAVVLGTDSPLAGLAILNHLGLRAEVKYGFQPWQALQTATLLPAKTFGYAKDLGSIEPGKLADLVFVAGDPLKRIQDAARVQRVMVDGRIYTIPELIAPFSSK
jgi:Tol biopolymer transport system component/cytosine/adenosine deaminase-related metal-dependent hydrolase